MDKQIFDSSEICTEGSQHEEAFHLWEIFTDEDCTPTESNSGNNTRSSGYMVQL